MPDFYLSLSEDDRREVLRIAADQSQRPANLLEKDVYVVWALNALFTSAIGKDLVFKGGTSLSKVYGAINRFSEDIDLTYDIRAIAPDLVADQSDGLPNNRSEEKRWSRAVRTRLPEWVQTIALPIVQAAFDADNLAGTITAEADKIFIAYTAVTKASEYVVPRVMLEFGARSTGEPNAFHDVVCDAAAFVETVAFPTARPQTMTAERTFWEKATAVHVFCAQKRLRGERFARHWYDLVRLDDAGLADPALADKDLAKAVATHKSMFFAEKDAAAQVIGYDAAVKGGLVLVPEGDARTVLKADYDMMVKERLFLDEVEPFDTLMERCADLAARANAVA